MNVDALNIVTVTSSRRPAKLSNGWYIYVISNSPAGYIILEFLSEIKFISKFKTLLVQIRFSSTYLTVAVCVCVSGGGGD